MSATATQVDQGKLITAQLPGLCAECGGSIERGDPIYFSRTLGPRHKRCVVAGDADPPAERDAPRDVTRDDAARRAARDFDAARASRDVEASRAPRDGDGRDDYGQPADDDARRPIARDDAARDATAADGGRAARSEFARAGERDAARKELGVVLDLMIEALQRIRRLLS